MGGGDQTRNEAEKKSSSNMSKDAREGFKPVKQKIQSKAVFFPLEPSLSVTKNNGNLQQNLFSEKKKKNASNKAKI